MATEFISNSWLMPTNANAEANRVSNYSLDFDGTQDVDCGNDSIFNNTFTGNAFSFSVWVKSSSNVAYDGILNFSSRVQSFLNSNKIKIWLQGSSGYIVTAFTSNTTILSDTWYHIVFTKNGNDNTLYINGVSDNTVTSTGNVASTTGNFRIGSYNGSQYFWDGNLTEVSIFDYSLSASQVLELYGTGSAIGNPMAITNGRKPVAYYPLSNSAFNGEFLVPNGAEQDYVFDFSGTNYINCANDSSLQITGALTVSVWFKILNNSGNRALVTRDTGSTQRNWSLYITSTGTLKLLLRNNTDTGWNIVESSSAFDDGKWHQGAFVYTPSTSLILYVDGVAVDTNTTSITSSINNETADFTIGAYSPNQGYTGDRWIGQISNVATFNTSLPATGAESVESLYNYGTPPNIASYSGLQAWWELDASATFDGSNWSIPDASSNSNTGTSSNMTAANLILSDLIINQPFDSFALDFDGTNDYIDLGSNISQSFSELSISTWINVDSSASGAYDTIIRRGTWSSGAFELRNNASYAGLKFAIYPGTANVTTTGVTLNDGKWHHISVTYDGTNVKIYFDGSLNNSTTNGTGATGTSTQITTIAASDQGTSRYYEGKISNVSIYNSELSATQVTTLYNEGKPFDLNNFAVTPVSWWRLGAVNSSYNSTTSEWTILDEIGTNNGTGSNLGPAQTALTDGVGATGSGLSSGMSSGTNRTGDAPYSDNNAISYNMSVTAKSTSVPT